MITNIPSDFSPHTYDIRTTDGQLWHFEATDLTAALVCGDLRCTLMMLGDNITLFEPGYRNINIHGFTINGTKYDLAEAVRNANWTAPIEPTIALYVKERAFVVKLLEYAASLNVNLLALSDINITTLLTAAKAAGATDIQIATASAILLALTRDIEAEAGMVWAACWLALKYRLPGYIAELLNAQA